MLDHPSFCRHELFWESPLRPAGAKYYRVSHIPLLQSSGRSERLFAINIRLLKLNDRDGCHCFLNTWQQCDLS